MLIPLKTLFRRGRGASGNIFEVYGSTKEKKD